jgi:hypothetical protein
MKKVAIGLAIALVALIAFVATRPDTYRVARSQEVAAPADVVFAHVDSYRAWPAWSPWEKQDPAMEKKYEGPERGAGAMYSWKSDKVGAGKMTTLESEAGKHVGIELEFIAPFENTARADFAFEPIGANATKVTWSMEGKNNFMGKFVGLFMDMDSMIGKDFEAGLNGLKSAAEADAQKRAAEQAAAAGQAAQPATAATP